jgi:hypothetical protein
VGAAIISGAVTHAVLFVGYGLFKAGVIGNAGLVVYGAVVGFTPIILAALTSRFFKPGLLRPVLPESLFTNVPPQRAPVSSSSSPQIRHCRGDILETRALTLGDPGSQEV